MIRSNDTFNGEDYRTILEAEKRIGELQKQLAAIELNKLDRILELLERRLPARAL